MTWDEIQQMREHNARMKAALSAILQTLEWELEDDPDASMIRVAVGLGEAALANRDVGAKA